MTSVRERAGRFALVDVCCRPRNSSAPHAEHAMLDGDDGTMEQQRSIGVVRRETPHIC